VGIIIDVMSESVAVHFKQQFPIFPLPETMLLPHAIMPLSVFESRYCQLTDHALDGSGQLAIATYCDSNWNESSGEMPPIRDAVCLAQIVHHEKVGNGHNMMVYGLCRAKIIEEILPEEGSLYRKAKLKPLEPEEEELDEIFRVELLHMLHRPNLTRLENHESIVNWVVEPDLTNTALFELIGCSVFDDAELRYELLSEPSCEKRSKRVLSELSRLDRLLSMIDKQSNGDLDFGITQN
jgi:Lon protease-like protein